MELRKDPITRSWVVIGQPKSEAIPREGCPFCPAQANSGPAILSVPPEGPWQVRVVPHAGPLYELEGEVGRRADGIYDRMGAVGAHEVVVETPDHELKMSHLSDPQIDTVLKVYGQRILDLKRDMRFKYVTVSKDQGPLSGTDWTHSHSQVMATTFVPRRILYELRASRVWFTEKERCVFCDIVHQEEKRGKRIVDTQGEYVALCPFASRVPYETWILRRKTQPPVRTTEARIKSHAFGRAGRPGFASVERLAEGYHMVLHTAPNTASTKGDLADYWTTIADDYHWHMEILPLLASRPKSYNLKEIYLNPLEPELAAERLRADPGM